MSASERLMAWVDDVQLSARLGTPHYANPGELKADIRELALSLAEAVEALERLASTEGFMGAISVNPNDPLWLELAARGDFAAAALARIAPKDAA